MENYTDRKIIPCSNPLDFEYVEELAYGKGKVLSLEDDDIESLEGNTTYSFLSLKNCKNLRSLGDNISGEKINLTGCTALTKLPSGLLASFLNISRTGILEIPEDLGVTYDLRASYSSLTTLPKNFSMDGTLSLDHCSNLEELPKGISIGEDLNLSECENLRELPNHLCVGHKLILQGASINALPSDLKVGGDIDLRGSYLDSLPDNFKVAGNLNLHFCQNLKTLPKGMVVLGDLDITKTDIKVLPEDLIVCGRLYTDSTEIKIPRSTQIYGGSSLNDFEIQKRLVSRYPYLQFDENYLSFEQELYYIAFHRADIWILYRVGGHKLMYVMYKDDFGNYVEEWVP